MRPRDGVGCQNRRPFIFQCVFYILGQRHIEPCFKIQTFYKGPHIQAILGTCYSWESFWIFFANPCSSLIFFLTLVMSLRSSTCKTCHQSKCLSFFLSQIFTVLLEEVLVVVVQEVEGCGMKLTGVLNPVAWKWCISFTSVYWLFSPLTHWCRGKMSCHFA